MQSCSSGTKVGYNVVEMSDFVLVKSSGCGATSNPDYYGLIPRLRSSSFLSSPPDPAPRLTRYDPDTFLIVLIFLSTTLLIGHAVLLASSGLFPRFSASRYILSQHLYRDST